MMSSAPSPAPRHAVADRCSSCGARLRPAETWCSLCHTPVTDGVPVAEDIPAAAPADPDPVEDDGPEADPAVNAIADRLLTELAAAETILERESSLGSLRLKVTELAGGHGAILLAVGGGVLLLALSLLGLTLIGLLV
jgi:hypothetical protein